jgi:hypothetical protein
MEAPVTMKGKGKAVVLLALLSIGSSVASAAANKHSRDHDVAVQRCVAAYEAGVKAAHAPGSPTGEARKRTMHRLAEEKKACIAKAPR